MDMRAIARVEAHLSTEAAAGAGWQVTAASWTEQLDRPYAVTIDLAHEQPEADVHALLGASVELVLERRDVQERVAGIVTSAREGLRPDEEGARGIITVEPALAATRHRKDSRIFQERTVPEILEHVLGADLAVFGRSISNELSRTYAPREYTVQYEETDFDFAQRLMEEEGIVYYFRHEGGPELMVLTDRNGDHPRVEAEGGSVLPHSVSWGVADDEGVRRLESVSRITGSRVSVQTFDWTHPTTPITAGAATAEGPELEAYEVDAPVTFGGFGASGYTSHDAAAQARLARERQARDRHLAEGIGSSLAIRAGHRFEIVGHPRADRDREYLAVGVEHRFLSPVDAHGVPREFEYYGVFRCVPADVQWRPDRTRDRPRIPGVQTATVVGPSGEEIHTDEHGRVKVRFHWDRLAPGDERSSCWIRVMQSMSGPGWGFTFVPRIGQEVVVTFVNGDPDQPLITGTVFNGSNPLALDYPANKTRMTIKTSSSPGGQGFNELRFEDKAGEEEIWLHGEKDWNTLIKNDLNRRVGHDETQEVVRHRTRTVGGNETVHVVQDLVRQVDQNETEVVALDRTRSVGRVESLTVGADRNKSVALNENVLIGKSASRQIGDHLVEAVGQSVHRRVGTDESVEVGANASTSIVQNRQAAVGENDTIQVGSDRSITIGGSHAHTVKGDEKVTVRKNRVANVGLTETVSVGIAQTINVSGMRTVSVGKMQTTTIGGASNLTVTGAFTTKVGADHAIEVTGSEAIKVGDGRTIEVTKGDFTVDVKEGAFRVSCGSTSLTLENNGDIVLQTDGAVRVLGAGGVEINGRPGSVVVQGATIDLN